MNAVKEFIDWLYERGPDITTVPRETLYRMWREARGDGEEFTAATDDRAEAGEW